VTEGGAPGEAEQADPGATNRWIGIGVGAVGVVGVGVGSVFGLVASSKLSQSNQGGNCDSSDHCSANGLALRKDASDAATLSTVFFVIGGVALATGVVLYLTAPRRPAGAAWVVAPVPMAAGGGALVSGSF
jgi:hypothetical protein